MRRNAEVYFSLFRVWVVLLFDLLLLLLLLVIIVVSDLLALHPLYFGHQAKHLGSTLCICFILQYLGIGLAYNVSTLFCLVGKI